MKCHEETGQKVLPVFYYVDPSDVRGQKRDFATAFERQEEKFRGKMDKVNKWREALTAAASLSGFPISKTIKEGESAIITKIVQEILRGISPRGIPKNLIGIESRVDGLNKLLDMDATNEVRVVGIHGMGGIGKTTIAKALYRRISYKFDRSCFVSEVRESNSTKREGSSAKRHMCSLQEKMLRDFVGHTISVDQDREHGANLIQHNVCNKAVLLVLDDVDDIEQLEFLAASHDWFGAGSRIIITTRDEHLLANADDIYKPDFLIVDQALQLFSMNAFKQSTPPEGYEELSNQAVYYTSCLPLALVVLGSFFHKRDSRVWESALNRLTKTPNRKIFETLKISFDGLEDSEKEIFLDIACFFKGKDEEHTTRVLDSFGLDAVMGISVLVEKSLITISNNRLDMHDQIQEMGWKIVCDNFPNSRLWQLEKIHNVINKNMKLEEIRAIMLPGNEYHIDEYKETLGFSADVIEQMKCLRLLDIDFKFTSHEPVSLPDELRWICWNKYPFLSLPLADMGKLHGLEMDTGNITHLWEGRKILPNLKFILLERLHDLTSFPDVSGAPYIQKLVLKYCQKLTEVDESLGFLKKLVYLDMSYCSKLKRLPSRIEMESLETLILRDCMSLERFLEVSQCMVKLSHIDCGSCYRMQDLRSSIRYLKRLSFLNLSCCRNLKVIPNSICKLKCLKSIFLHHCWKLQKLPEGFGSMENLEELRFGCIVNLKGVRFGSMEDFEEIWFRSMGKLDLSVIDFHTLAGLSSLKRLDLTARQIEAQKFPNDSHAFSLLEELNLSHNSKLIQLPTVISHLSRLRCLVLNKCDQLQTLYALPSSIQILKANECSSLEKIGDLSKECKWLYKIWFNNCHKLRENGENGRFLDNLLQKSFVEKCATVNHRLSIIIPGSKIPSWFKEEKNGCEMALKLTPQWHTKILGFMVSGVFPLNRWPMDTFPQISFKIIYDGKVILKSEVGGINVNEKAEDGNVWMSYMPLGFFQEKYHDLQPEDWSHIEGNLVMTIKSTSDGPSVRCGVHVVYQEDVEAVQQSRACISKYGNLVDVNKEDVGYDLRISGNTYVYREKLSDGKVLLPLGIRASRRHIKTSVSVVFTSYRSGSEDEELV